MATDVDARTGEEKPKGSERVLKALDLCVELDEPTLLIDELRRAAERMAVISSGKPEEWAKVAERARDLQVELNAMQEPPVAA